MQMQTLTDTATRALAAIERARIAIAASEQQDAYLRAQIAACDRFLAEYRKETRHGS